MIRQRFASRVAHVAIAIFLSIPVFAFTGSTGCTPSQLAWIASFLTTVNSFVQYATVAWSILLPILPIGSQAGADAEFKRELAVLSDAEAASESVLQVARAAGDQNPTVDFTAIKSAVASVMDIIHKYSAPAATGGRLGAVLGGLENQAASIKAWK